MAIRNSIALLASIALSFTVSAQEGKPEFVPSLIGFFNIENLFDTIDSPDTDDREFLPESGKLWGTQRYLRKVDKMGQVIAALGRELDPRGVAILGLAEVENRSVVEDLVVSAPLKERKYAVVHDDSPDRRGVDVALIHDPKRFKVYAHKSYRLVTPPDTAFRTRDQLLVSGVLDGDTTHVIVAHWPSRRGGEKRSMPKRMAAGELGRHVVDSLLAINANARILYMGDLNDDPVSPSLTKVLGCKADPEKTKSNELFNPWVDNYKKGIGTSPYQDAWGLFDQVLFSGAWINKDQEGYRFFKHVLFNKEFMVQKTGKYRGYSKRTWDGTTYNYGYSDHFPVYVMMVKKINQ